MLRDALDADVLDPAGIYFGTRNGTVWSSSNGGASWSAAIEGLPPVVCVKAAVVGDPARIPTARATAKRAVKRVKATASTARAKVRVTAAKARGRAKVAVARMRAKAAARKRK